MGLLVHFFFRFVDELMSEFILDQFASCGGFLLSLFYFLSFSLFIVFFCSWFVLFISWLLGLPFSLSTLLSWNVVNPLCHVLSVYSIYQGDSQPDGSAAGSLFLPSSGSSLSLLMRPVDVTAAREMSSALAPSVTTSTMSTATEPTTALTTATAAPTTTTSKMCFVV